MCCLLVASLLTGGGAFSQVLSRAARKRLNKKNRVESEAKTNVVNGKVKVREEGKELLDLLVSPSSPTTSAKASVGITPFVSPTSSGQDLPPPPGLGFTPTSRKEVRKEFEDELEGVTAVLAPLVEEKKRQEVYDDDDSDDEDEEIIVKSRSGFSIRF